jgi:hypothetical protein
MPKDLSIKRFWLLAPAHSIGQAAEFECRNSSLQNIKKRGC